MTDALSQLRQYYRLSKSLKVATIICGDFNSCPRGGVYEFMRTGQFDCLKLNKYDVSGQNYAMYGITDEPAVISLTSSSLNLV